MKFIHGHSLGTKNSRGSKTYKVWVGMIQRCTNPKNPVYRHYGGRGIEVCESWRSSFVAFLSDMGEKPNGFTIDRIDTNGHYCKQNCRWATTLQQQRNKRNTIRVNYNNKTYVASELAEKFGMKPDVLYKRIYLGWSPERAIETPAYATFKERARHRRNNRILTHNGQTMTVAEWAEKLHWNSPVIYHRLQMGWSVKRTLEQKLRIWK